MTSYWGMAFMGKIPIKLLRGQGPVANYCWTEKDEQSLERYCRKGQRIFVEKPECNRRGCGVSILEGGDSTAGPYIPYPKGYRA